MNTFMNCDFCISEINLACHIIKATPIHKNRPCHGVAFNASGTVKYTFDTGKTVIAYKNDIIYLPKGSNYTVDIVEEVDCYGINFELQNPLSTESFKFSTKNFSHFAKLFSQAGQYWSKRIPGFHLKCKSILYEVLYSLQKEHNIQYLSSKKADLIRPAIDYIHSNYNKENINIIMLANLCDMSDTYFRGIFKQIYGISPLKYINNLRFECAKELILSGDYPIHEVSILSGFNDDSYFSREFKKEFGYSPNKFKQNY